MSDRTTDAIADVVRLNRVLAAEGVLDAFGHVSVRDPERADRFYLPRSCAPERVTAADVLLFDAAARPVDATTVALYAERVIHSGIYAARPDVMAICHHHAPAVLPFCLGALQLAPVTQLGAVVGTHVPMWDSRTRFGATNHLVVTADEGADLAASLGAAPLVLMRRHGATVVASTVPELAFRAVYGVRNAEAQYRAALLGPVDALTPEETRLAERFPPASLNRAWQLWLGRLPAG